MNSLIILVPYCKSCLPRFSTDEGQCWYKYTFSKEPIFFTGLASEPGAKSMNVSVWGFRGSFLSRKWVSYTIDFADLLVRSCEFLLPPSFPCRETGAEGLPASEGQSGGTELNVNGWGMTKRGQGI